MNLKKRDGLAHHVACVDRGQKTTGSWVLPHSTPRQYVVTAMIEE